MPISLESAIFRAYDTVRRQPILLAPPLALPLLAMAVWAAVSCCGVGPAIGAMHTHGAGSVALLVVAYGLCWLAASVVLGVYLGGWSEMASEALAGREVGLVTFFIGSVGRCGRFVLCTAVVLLAMTALALLPLLGLDVAVLGMKVATGSRVGGAVLALPVLLFWGLAGGVFTFAILAWPAAAVLENACWLRPLILGEHRLRLHWPTALGLFLTWSLGMGLLWLSGAALRLPALLTGLVHASPTVSHLAFAFLAIAGVTLWLAGGVLTGILYVAGFHGYRDAMEADHA